MTDAGTPIGVPSTARASVALPERRSEVRTFGLPGPGADEGWLEVTASGICGTDVAMFARGLSTPTVLGHHVVGRVAALGEQAGRERGLAAGDRVVLEEYLPCGRCPTCASGRYRLCPDTDIWSGGRRVGTISATEPPGLTGGNGEYVFLPRGAVVHRLPDELDEELAAWVLPYANAIDWVRTAGGLEAGQAVVVLGPGYHGLAVAAAARWAGASSVVVGGLPRDTERLGIAEALGATPVVLDDPGSIPRRIAAATGGAPDLVVDTVGADPAVIGPAAESLRHGGHLVLTSPKRPEQVPVDTGLLIRRELRLAGVRGRSPEAIRTAIGSLADGSSHLDAVPTVEVGLDGVGDMLARLADGRGPESPHVVVRPGAA